MNKLFQVTREEFHEALVEAIQESIPFNDIGKFLPFQTRVVMGVEHNHIQSTCAFVIKTENRLVKDGDTLCGRKSPFAIVGNERKSDCPDCDAIGKGLAVRDLL